MRKFSTHLCIIMILCFLPIYTHANPQEQFYLLPDESKTALKAILKKIEGAKSSIHISIYNFTHKKIAKKLKNAAKRGVKIEIIFDEKSIKQREGKSMLPYLAKYKNIRVYKLKGKRAKDKKYHGIMHMKMAVIDQKTTIFGSANWTYSAFSNNYELLYICQNYAIAKKFEKHFKVLKKKAKRYR